MTYTSGSGLAAPPMVSVLTPGWGPGITETYTGSAPASSTFEVVNAAAYFPILVPATCVVRRLWWANGSVVSASYNVDAAVYADAGYAPGARLVSTGSTAQGTASQVQFVDVTDTTLAPGRYWLALACSSNVATFFRMASGSGWDALFQYSQSSALPLPATATPAEAADQAKVYLFGFATTASP